MASSNPLTTVNRELKQYRNLPDAGHALGVCAGVAYRLAWPTWVVRISFLVLLFGFGAGLLVYLLVGFLAPNAHTPKDYARRTGG